MRNPDAIEHDHKFEFSPFCDCDSCNELCHYHYGQEDACIKERHMHSDQMLELMPDGYWV